MSKKFKIKRKYYDERIIYKKSEIEINPGVTILIGCNGSGKTTLQQIIKAKLDEENINYMEYNNLIHGGQSAIGSFAFKGNTEKALIRMTSSEGEEIRENISDLAYNIGRYIKTGEYDGNFKALIRAFRNGKDNDDEQKVTNERWLLFDAIDSGYSIDNVIEFKDLLKIIMEDNEKRFHKDLYIIITANEYEMCIDLPCFNVIDGKYVEINSYDEYKKIILKSREYKDKQINKWLEEED